MWDPVVELFEDLWGGGSPHQLVACQIYDSKFVCAPTERSKIPQSTRARFHAELNHADFADYHGRILMGRTFAKVSWMQFATTTTSLFCVPGRGFVACGAKLTAKSFPSVFLHVAKTRSVHNFPSSLCCLLARHLHMYE